jgi:hypothetical protein
VLKAPSAAITQGALVTINGDNFTVGGNVSYKVLSPTAQKEAGNIIAGSSGSFNLSLKSAQWEPGSYKCVAVDENTKQPADCSFEVKEAPRLTLAVAPLEGPPGTAFTLRASGLTPNGKVSYKVSRRGGDTVEEGTLTAPASGSGSVTFTKTYEPGDYYCLLTDADTGRDITVSANINGDAVPAGAKLVVWDDLNTAKTRFPTGSDNATGSNWGYLNGGYTVSTNGGTRYFYVQRGAGNFILEFDVTHVTRDAWSLGGAIFGVNSVSGNLNRFTVALTSDKGEMFFARHLGGVQTNPLGAVNGPPSGEGKPYHIKIVRQSPRIEIYGNHVKVGELNDASLANGDVALYTSNFRVGGNISGYTDQRDNATWKFNNLLFYTLN